MDKTFGISEETHETLPVQSRLKFADQLQGRLLGDWQVLDCLNDNNEADATGGYFSVAYSVANIKSGRTAFLKAFDLERVLEPGSSGVSRMSALMTMTTAFQFETTVLEAARRMDRVVEILDKGEVTLDPSNVFSYVPYIIFEKADADIRRHLRDAGQITVKQRLKLLHHVATGLMQLHNGMIAHQDLKPSNVLVWNSGGAKIADLGRSSLRGSAGQNDLHPFAGGMAYAPPETLYNHLHPDWNERRVPIDLYLLGSFVVYLFSQASMPALMFGRFLAPQHQPQLVWNGSWTGTFVEVLPYLEVAFADSVIEFERNLPAPISKADYRAPIVQLVQDMCHPDPAQRGIEIKYGKRTRALNRVVTLLDRLSYEA